MQIKGGKKSSAAKADRYDLYLLSVQAPEHEVEFFERVYTQRFDKAPKVLREDFCGTFAVCCEWVKGDDKRTAVGVDLDEEPLAWGRKHHLAELKQNQQDRIALLKEDVRQTAGPKADIVAGQNFSFYCFTTRADLLKYFKAARSNLKSEGMFLLDMMGGSDCLKDDEIENREVNDFTYVWEQRFFNPITHATQYHIHFKFPDGSRINEAFTYDWRQWMIPEVTELLWEAGFDDVTVYWEGVDDKGEGNDEYEPAESGAADPAWIAYIVGWKQKAKK